jgi:uncharacterized RDD family membrane protein YckC
MKALIMSNDPYGDLPPDPAPEGWAHGSGDGGYATGPEGGYAPGWGQSPLPTGGRPASVGKRTGALLLDSIGIGIVVNVVLLPTQLGIGDTYIRSIIIAIAAIAYFSLMEAGSGQTIAKRLLGIRVVSEDGSPLTLQQALMRRVPFYVGSVIPTALGGLITFGLLLGILITAIQEQTAHQGLHDKWARTRVIEV